MTPEAWVQSLVSASLLGGVFVAAVWILCLVARRLPASVKAWLWWIACVQFLVRLFLSVPIPIPANPQAAPEPIPTWVYEGALVPHKEVDLYKVEVADSAPRPAESQGPQPEAYLFAVWAVGVAFGSAIAARRLLATRRLLRQASPLEDANVVRILSELGAHGGPRPRLLESDRVKCPLLAGCWSPVIVVPTGFAKDHREGEIRMALAHELIHIRRRDQWLALAIAAAQIVFFFHPLVWLAAREAGLAREEACDLDVLRLCGESPAAYAHFLLKSAQARTPVAALGAAYGYRNLRRRITMLKRSSSALHTPFRRTWRAVLAAGIVAALPWSVVAQSSKAGAAAPKPKAKNAASIKPSKGKAARTAKATGKIAPKPSTARRTTSATSASKAFAAKTGSNRATVAMPGAPGGFSPSVSRPTTTSPLRMGDKPQPPAGGNPNQIGGMPGAGAPPAAGATNPVAAIPGSGAPPAAGATNSVAGMPGGGVPMPGGGALPSPGAKPVAGDAELTMGAETPLERTISITCNGMDLRDAIVSALSAANVNFVVKAKLQPEPVTCRLKDTTVLHALEAILKGSNQNLSYRVEGGVVYIVERG